MVDRKEVLDALYDLRCAPEVSGRTIYVIETALLNGGIDCGLESCVGNSDCVVRNDNGSDEGRLAAMESFHAVFGGVVDPFIAERIGWAITTTGGTVHASVGDDAVREALERIFAYCGGITNLEVDCITVRRAITTNRAEIERLGAEAEDSAELINCAYVNGVEDGKAISRERMDLLEQIRYACEEWREWRERNHIISESAHETGIIRALDEYRGGRS